MEVWLQIRLFSFCDYPPVPSKRHLWIDVMNWCHPPSVLASFFGNICKFVHSTASSLQSSGHSEESEKNIRLCIVVQCKQLLKSVTFEFCLRYLKSYHSIALVLLNSSGSMVLIISQRASNYTYLSVHQVRELGRPKKKGLSEVPVMYRERFWAGLSSQETTVSIAASNYQPLVP